MEGVLLSVHVLTSIIFIGPVTLATSLFPRYAKAALEEAVAARIEAAFAHGSGHGLLRLGAGEVGRVLPPIFGWLRAKAMLASMKPALSVVECMDWFRKRFCRVTVPGGADAPPMQSSIDGPPDRHRAPQGPWARNPRQGRCGSRRAGC